MRRVELTSPASARATLGLTAASSTTTAPSAQALACASMTTGRLTATGGSANASFMLNLHTNALLRCGSHYFAGMSGFPCSNCKRKKQQAKFKDPEYMKTLAMFLLGQGEMPVDSDDSEDEY